MRFSLSSIVRLGVGAIIVSSATALVLARVVPAPTGWRMACPVAYTSINSFYLDPCSRGSVWIERDGGATVGRHRKGDDELIEYASFSPWRDESGRCQVVGRWSWGFRGDSPDNSFGLARMTFPDGEVLDHVETEVVPVSSPCWYPDTRARVLFAAGDGKLYQCAFEPAGAPGTVSDGAEDRPRALTWNCPVPGEDGVYLTEPDWPSDPRLRNIVFVGLRVTPPARTAGRKAGPTQIWWLRLSDDGASIVEAGRLLEDSADGLDVIERCPIVGRSSAGRTVLAYFRKLPSQSLSLHVVDIEVDPERNCPRTVLGPGAKLADDCLASPPVFSKDGRWLNIVRKTGGGRNLSRIRLEEGPSRTSVATQPRLARADTASVR
jgi:hypothetical protein